MSYEITMPLKDGSHISVSVSPSKTYGDKSGLDLIREYSKRKIKELPINSVEVDPRIIFIPIGYLEEITRVNGETYNTRALFDKIAEKYKIQILLKSTLKAKKVYRNTSLILPKNLLASIL